MNTVYGTIRYIQVIGGVYPLAGPSREITAIQMR